LALPFLLVLVVGIIDFGQAYNLKQKLNDAAREGTRFAVQLSCSDCTQTAPATTQTLENSIVSYLTTGRSHRLKHARERRQISPLKSTVAIRL
jgi:Flp pilus assembly protein TadG